MIISAFSSNHDYDTYHDVTTQVCPACMNNFTVVSFEILTIQALKFVDVVSCLREKSCFQDTSHLF